VNHGSVLRAGLALDSKTGIINSSLARAGDYTFNAAANNAASKTNDKCVWCSDMFGVRSNAASQAWYDSCAQFPAAWGMGWTTCLSRITWRKSR